MHCRIWKANRSKCLRFVGYWWRWAGGEHNWKQFSGSVLPNGHLMEDAKYQQSNYYGMFRYYYQGQNLVLLRIDGLL